MQRKKDDAEHGGQGDGRFSPHLEAQEPAAESRHRDAGQSQRNQKLPPTPQGDEIDDVRTGIKAIRQQRKKRDAIAAIAHPDHGPQQQDQRQQGPGPGQKRGRLKLRERVWQQTYGIDEQEQRRDICPEVGHSRIERFAVNTVRQQGHGKKGHEPSPISGFGCAWKKLQHDQHAEERGVDTVRKSRHRKAGQRHQNTRPARRFNEAQVRKQCKQCQQSADQFEKPVSAEHHFGLHRMGHENGGGQ